MCAVSDAGSEYILPGPSPSPEQRPTGNGGGGAKCSSGGEGRGAGREWCFRRFPLPATHPAPAPSTQNPGKCVHKDRDAAAQQLECVSAGPLDPQLLTTYYL
jgi:hypothetical protein